MIFIYKKWKGRRQTMDEQAFTNDIQSNSAYR